MSDPNLDDCGCCEPDPAPAPLYNRPGLPALSYRAGTYGTIFQRMRNRIGMLTIQDGHFAGTRPLAPLATREQDDPSIALLDASAIIADVLTFYQERIANEGFLRTATERRSILEMAREIGYELSPGVAASAYLSFVVDEAEGAPGVSTIPAGTKVQSIPPQGKLPQPFETSRELTAYKEWNTLRPRLSHPQQLTTSTLSIYLQGTGHNIKAGDRLLVDAGSQVMWRAITVEIQPEFQRTRVDFATAPFFISPYTAPALPQGQVDINKQIALNSESIQQYILGLQWTDSDLNAFLDFNQWDRKKLLTWLAHERKTNPGATGSVHIFRSTVGLFGNNAPLYDSLKNGDGTALYPGQNWDSGNWSIWKSQRTGDYYYQSDVYLERVVQGLLPGSWFCLEGQDFNQRSYKIASMIECSRTGFGLSSKVNGLFLKKADGSLLNDTDTDKPDEFGIRTAIAHVQSEKLPLAELPFDDDLGADPAQLQLNGLALGLRVGQALALTGERMDAPGVTGSEILTIKSIQHVGGFTTLTFESGRQYPYKRSSLKINANTVAATHGETIHEILGSGDGAQIHQRFTLKKPPLTYTAAATPSGSASTLQLRVDNLRWDEAASLYGLDAHDQGYIIRVDDSANATLLFGDGEKGARLPTGQNNITATYRSGIGLEGQVDAGSLTLLPSKPFGVRSVINPLPASGAGDPEKMDDARRNAPLTVRTLDRIVSREDYEDFAAAFAGIGKAQAVDLWNGEQHLVHVTIGGEDGKPVGAGPFRDNFLAALNQARDPSQRVRVDTFDLLYFDLSAKVAVDTRYLAADVFASVKTALAQTFSFAQRIFGKPVTAAEVITTIQNVAGVIYVDLDALNLTSDGVPTLKQILLANTAHVGNGEIHRAQLLLINTLGIQLQEVSA